MKHTKYMLISMSLLTVISVGIYYGSLSSAPLSSSVSPIVSQVASNIIGTAGANPDYICVKQIDNAPCADLDNPPWNGSQTRVRTGKRLTSVYYMNRRTSCEPGYTSIGTDGTNNGGASGRDGRVDQPYAYSNSCTIIETDTVAPEVDPTAN